MHYWRAGAKRRSVRWRVPVRWYLIALLWAVWHVPDHFAVEGWGIQALISAPAAFAVEVVSLFFARALFVWFYNRTGSSVLLVAIFHASFDAAISKLSFDVVPASNTARFLIFSGVIILFAATVIIATKGRLGRRADVVPVPEVGDAAGEHTDPRRQPAPESDEA